MKARPWSRITRIGGPDSPASFPPHAEAQARALLRPYEAVPSAGRPAPSPIGADPLDSVDVAVPAPADGAAGPADGSLALWDAFATAAAGSYGAADFAERTLNHVLAVAERLRRTRGALAAALRPRASARRLALAATSAGTLEGVPGPAPDSAGNQAGTRRGTRRHAWPALLAHAVSASGDVAPAAVVRRFSDWCIAQIDTAETALGLLWSRPLPPSARAEAIATRIDRFLAGVPAHIAADEDERLHLASWLLLAFDPTRFPVYDAAFDAAAAALCALPVRDAGSDGARYVRMLALFDQVVEEASRRGVPLRHRLHARAVLEGAVPRWATPPARARQVAETSARYGDECADTPAGLAALAEALLIDQRELEQIERLLADRGQCIFFGPPGTGKTFVAQRLAACFAGSEARVETVQFHGSYAYEDFVEGYRPQLVAGQPGFALVPGSLRRLAATAAADPLHRYVLVVDELNRGNIAKVFGELYFLLEYRDQAITLQYSGDRFMLPRNLWVIGTMNTADRSLALVDLALRRRFYFVPFFPDQPPIAGLLRRWFERHRPSLAWVADVVDEANRMLDDRDAAIGPSAFLRPDLDETWVGLIWQHAILPYVAERLGHDGEALAPFALDRLRARVTPPPPRPTREPRTPGRRRAAPVRQSKR